MKEDKELFPVDLTKERYKIEIIVRQNGHTFGLHKINKEEPNMTYQELIGILEIVKNGFLAQHRESILKTIRKNKKKESSK